MKTTPPIAAANPPEAEKKSINPELWQACAGPLVNLPAAGTHVVYFPQGHSEQVAASMKKDVDAQIPNYPNLPSKLICYLHNVTLHADPETDEVYAQMTLQPVPSIDKEALLRSDLSMKVSKPQTDFFCKTLTASDTSTHGGFSVPRRAADKIFPPLDYSMQPPAQELVARDLHDNVWSFRHIYRGQPKRHLLTTGWSLFVSGKRLFAGDSVLFIRDEKQQLLLGIRRANRQPANLSSSVLSSDSMHIGILAAAAHAAANNSPFTVFYNPRASPSEFVIPLAKYYKAVYGNQVSLGMRFRMMFETEESGTRRYMGTITGITDLDPMRWKGSQWRNLQVGWDESTGGERRSRVSIWDIEPVIAPFFICPPPTPPQFFRPKRPRQPGMPDDDEVDGFFKRTMPWTGCDDFGVKEPQGLPGLSLAQWMNMQSNTPSLAAPPAMHQPNTYLPSSLPGSVLQSLAAAGGDLTRQLCLPQIPQQNCLQFNSSQPPAVMNQLGSSIMQPHQQQLSDACQQQPRQSLISQALQTNHVQAQLLQAQNIVQSQNGLQTIQNQLHHRNLPPQHPQQILNQSQQPQSFVPSHPTNPITQQLHLPDNNNSNNTQLQFQLLQKIQQQQQQQQQSLLVQQSQLQQPSKIQDVLQSVSVSLPQSHVTINNNQTNLMFSQQPQMPKLLQQQQPMLAELPGPVGQTNVVFANGSSPGPGGGGQSIITDDVPSCSTSPSTNNCPNGRVVQRSTTVGDDVMQSSSILLSSGGGGGGLETALSGSSNLAIKELQQKGENRNSNSNNNSNPLMIISKSQQNQGFLTPPQVYLNNSGSAAQMDYLDSSSSATSICLSQNDAPLQQCTNPTMSFGSQPMFFRDLSQDGGEAAHGGGDERNTISFTTNIDDSHLEIPTIPKFENHHPKFEPAAELSSSMVSQSFGVADMGGFNSLDSAIDDGSFMNGGANWAQQPPMPRMRTYTKVYKRGAVGRSIDITRYSGYDELKQDLARRFGIEGQLEDRQRVGWKLVYVDHENDVLLVGDDPWEEFVNCVRCIKILSPQEVQQMSLDGDFGNNVLQNQTCSSSDGGNV